MGNDVTNAGTLGAFIVALSSDVSVAKKLLDQVYPILGY